MVKVPFGKCDECSLKDAIYVPSEINDSKILILVEAPGYHEAQELKPLVGVAGQDLKKIIESCDGKREHFCYINSVTCRPTKVESGKTYNRTPTNAEIDFCHDRLVKEIDDLHPTIIICMGKIPYVALGGDSKAAMKDVVGTQFVWRGLYDVVVTYQPAAISHSGGAGSERGKKMRDEIEKAIQLGFKTKPRPKQLKLC